MNYSQHNEDQFLADFFQGKNDGFFVDIGANDGIKGSNTRALWERGWSGVMVEGSYPTFQQLLIHYKDQPRIRLVYAAVCDKIGVVTFYDHKHFCSGWSSMDKSFVDAMDISTYHGELTPATTLSHLGLPDTFDFLSVDTEGSDYEVLLAMPAKMQPRLIMAEIDKHDNLRRIGELLGQRGYRQVWFDDIDKSNAAFARNE